MLEASLSCNAFWDDRGRFSRALDAAHPLGILCSIFRHWAGGRVGADCRIVIWAFGGAEAPSELADKLRETCPDILLAEGEKPPDTRCDMLIIWSETNGPAADTVALEARQAGLAHVVAIIAPGARGMLEGPNDSTPSHVVKIDPAWGSPAITTVLQVALAGARECARAEDIATTQEGLIAIASHDLRTPVSTLRLLHDLFRSRLNASTGKHSPGVLSDLEEMLDIMERNLEKMDEFIGDILEAWLLFRGRPQLVKEAVSLGSIAEDIVAGLFPLALKKDIALDLMTDQSVGSIMAEPRRVGQVVANLVENAVKYTPSGGSVTVRTFSDPEAGGAVLEVADTGPGVPEDERGRLFQRFGRGSVKTTAGEPSTGLGLFICREIVEQHGGRIWFEPVEGPGHGSRFYALWPYSEASSESRDNTGDAPTGGGR